MNPEQEKQLRDAMLRRRVAQQREEILRIEEAKSRERAREAVKRFFEQDEVEENSDESDRAK
jgi:hypothetical protein